MLYILFCITELNNCPGNLIETSDAYLGECVYCWQSVLQSCDTAPRFVKVPAVQFLQRGGARGVVRGDDADVARCHRLREQFSIRDVSQGRSTLELCSSVWYVLLGEQEIVRTRLDRDRQPFCLSLQCHRQYFCFTRNIIEVTPIFFDFILYKITCIGSEYPKMIFL